MSAGFDSLRRAVKSNFLHSPSGYLPSRLNRLGSFQIESYLLPAEFVRGPQGWDRLVIHPAAQWKRLFDLCVALSIIYALVTAPLTASFEYDLLPVRPRTREHLPVHTLAHAYPLGMMAGLGHRRRRALCGRHLPAILPRLLRSGEPTPARDAAEARHTCLLRSDHKLGARRARRDPALLPTHHLSASPPRPAALPAADLATASARASLGRALRRGQRAACHRGRRRVADGMPLAGLPVFPAGLVDVLAQPTLVGAHLLARAARAVCRSCTPHIHRTLRRPLPVHGVRALAVLGARHDVLHGLRLRPDGGDGHRVPPRHRGAVGGACLSAIIFSNVAAVINKGDATSSRYEAQLESINEFIRFHRLPPSIRAKLHGYHDLLFSINRGFNLERIAAIFPRNVQEDTYFFMYERIVRRVPMFNATDDSFIRALVRLLKPQALLDGDYAFRQGEVGDTMYFVQHGIVQIGNTTFAVIYATL